MHERGLIHKDIKPANVLVDAASGNVRLTGFGIASRLPRERQAPEPPEFIAGHARLHGARADRPDEPLDRLPQRPLLARRHALRDAHGHAALHGPDPMEWVHCHIARSRCRPSERVADVPAPVAAIIMKLLAKTAEERYQTAAGVEADLRRCLAAWEAQRPHRRRSRSARTTRRTGC